MANPKSETAAKAAEDIKTKTAEIGESAKAEANRRAEGAKFTVADEISSVASALKVASREFGDGTTESKTFHQIAESLEEASNSVRQKSLGEMISDLNSFARRHPATFLGGAALLGFAASRFAKASAETPPAGTEAQSTRSTYADPRPEATQ